jgi:hypothetical protein
LVQEVQIYFGPSWKVDTPLAANSRLATECIIVDNTPHAALFMKREWKKEEKILKRGKK